MATNANCKSPVPDSSASTKNVHAGHRQRLKNEFIQRGLDGLSDYKILELLLIYAVPQRDMNPLAHDLLDRFGTLSDVLNASPRQLTAIKGVGTNTALLLQLVSAISKRYIQDSVPTTITLYDTDQLRDLLIPYFMGANHEMFYLICLNSRFQLLSCKQISDGDAFSTQVLPRTIAETALASNAIYVILAHNHPSGLAFPSEEDKCSTQKLYYFLNELDIQLYDHYIIADNNISSMREIGFFDQLEQD